MGHVTLVDTAWSRRWSRDAGLSESIGWRIQQDVYGILCYAADDGGDDDDGDESGGGGNYDNYDS